LFINRPAAYGREVEAEMKNKAEIIVAKQRNGPTGEVDLIFIDEFVQFANKEEIHQVPELVEDPF
ncbi:MAG: replicative DNA helicase, partial [Calditrichaeota bacterium]